MLPRGQVCVLTALMHMRWVIKRKPDSGSKARLVVLGFTDPQLGVKTHRTTDCDVVDNSSRPW